MKDHVFYANLKQEYKTIERGKGIYLWDTEGKRYIDASSGPLVSNIGHGVVEICDAISEQLNKIEYAHRLKFSTPVLQALSDKVIHISDGLIDWVQFCSGGSEAVETVLAMARSYFIEIGKPKKYKIITRWQSYHGATLGARSLGGKPSMRRDFAPLLIETPHCAPVYCYQCPFGKEPENCNLECVKDIEKVILQEGPENVAAVFIESITGSTAGTLIPHKDYLKQVRNLCDKYEILFAVDEIMTGIGRTGKIFAIQHWDVKPDIICMAKGLSSGYAPLGAVGVKDFIHEGIKNGSGSFWHGFTYGNNPVSAAAGLAVLNYMEKHRLVGNSLTMGDYLIKKLQPLFNKYKAIGDIRGKGLMVGVEFVKDRETRKPFPPELNLTNKILTQAMNSGLMLYGSPFCINGYEGDAVMISPPLVVTEEEIDLIIDLFDDVLKTVFNELRVY